MGDFLSLWWCWFSISNPQLLCPVPSIPCLEYNESHFLEYALGLTRFCPIQYLSLSFTQLIADVWSSLQEIPMYFALISNCLPLTIKVFLSKLNIWVKVGQDLWHYWGYLLRAVRRLSLRWKLQILSYFYSFQSFQSIFGLYMMKQYVVKLRKLFPQFYTVFLFLMSHPDNGGFLKIAQKRDSISKKTSFCIMVINTDHLESWFLSVGHPFSALR